MDLPQPSPAMILELSGDDRTVSVPNGFDALIIPIQPNTSVAAASNPALTVSPGCVVFAPADSCSTISLRAPFHALVVLSEAALRPTAMDTLLSNDAVEGPLSTVKIPHIVHPITKIARSFCASGNTVNPECVASVSNLLLSEIVSSYSKASENKQLRHLLPESMMRTISNFVSANLEETLTIGDLADVAGLSSYQFSRRFKETTGLSPFQYIIERRLLRAQQMLKEGRETIAEIAYSTGFSSQSHFTETFKRHWGITPGVFKNRFAASADHETV